MEEEEEEGSDERGGGGGPESNVVSPARGWGSRTASASLLKGNRTAAGSASGEAPGALC